MKKSIFILSLVLGLTFAASAQDGSGFFRRGNDVSYGNRDGENDYPMLPSHQENHDQPASVPMGSGALLLMGFGAAYALSKKNQKD